MRKQVLIVIFISFLYNSNLFSQIYSYIPFPDTSACWYEEHGWCDSGCSLCDFNVYKKVLREKKQINGKEYISVYNEGYSWYMSSCKVRYVYNFNSINGYIREDSSKRVYAVYLNNNSILTDSSEYLLYDFNLNAGDTLFQKDCSIVIDSVDTVSLAGTLRKRFWVNTNNGFGGNYQYNHYIEGIGGTGGLFTPMCSGEFENKDDLFCFVKDGIKVFDGYFFDTTTCTLPEAPEVYIGIDETDNKHFSIYPNPAQNKLIVSISSNPASKNDIQYQIINTLGGIVTAGNATAVAFSVDVSALPAGIYFIRLHSGNAAAVKRFVKE